MPGSAAGGNPVSASTTWRFPLAGRVDHRSPLRRFWRFRTVNRRTGMRSANDADHISVLDASSVT